MKSILSIMCLVTGIGAVNIAQSDDVVNTIAWFKAVQEYSNNTCHMVRTSRNNALNHADFAEPWNNSPANGDLMNVTCPDADNPEKYGLTVGKPNDQNYFVYNQGWSWGSDGWVEMPLTCERADRDWTVGNWCRGSASSTFTKYEPITYVADADGGNFDNFSRGYVASYICKRNDDGGGWDCGCRDEACSTNHWNLQITKDLQIAEPWRLGDDIVYRAIHKESRNVAFANINDYGYGSLTTSNIEEIAADIDIGTFLVNRYLVNAISNIAQNLLNQGRDNSLVLATHGWNSDGVWTTDMVDKMSERTTWHTLALNWEHDADTGLAGKALDNAENIGLNIGETLAKYSGCNLEEIHMIGHSAGSRLVLTAAYRYEELCVNYYGGEEEDIDADIYTTLLDAYTGTVHHRRLYNPDVYVEHIYNHGGPEEIFGNTKDLSDGKNLVLDRRPIHSPIPWIFNTVYNSGSETSYPQYTGIATHEHSFPYRWYLCSVDPEVEGCENNGTSVREYGFNQSPAVGASFDTIGPPLLCEFEATNPDAPAVDRIWREYCTLVDPSDADPDFVFGEI